MKKIILMNPGPTNVSESVRNAIKTNDICHREIEFSEVLHDVRKNLLKVVGGRKTHTAIPFIASATGSNEAVISSIRGKILLINNGKYSERLMKITERYHIPMKVLKFHPLEQINLKIIEGELKRNKKISHIVLVHHETTTGMLAPLRKIGHIAKKYKKILFVDTVSSVGGHDIDANLDNLSFFTVSANKCLESFPGISFVIARKRDLAMLKGKSRSFYFDLYRQWEYAEKNQTPFTPAVQLFLAIKLPTNMNYWKIHDALKKRGFVIYSEQDNLDQHIFRIATLGHITEKDIKLFLKSFKDSLNEIKIKPKYF